MTKLEIVPVFSLACKSCSFVKKDIPSLGKALEEIENHLDAESEQHGSNYNHVVELTEVKWVRESRW